MLYKRPNFKMGGSPTGIETLTPRVNARTGFGFLNLSPTTGDNTGYQEYMKKVRARRESGQPSGLAELFLGPRFLNPNFESPMKFSNKTGFEFLKPTGDTTPTIIAETQNTLSEDLINTSAGKNEQKALEGKGGGADFIDIVDKVVKNGDGNGKTKIDDNILTAKTKKEEIEEEAKFLNDLTGSGIGKGEAALILAKAVGTPGTITDKANIVSDELLKVARSERKLKQKNVLRAYEAYKTKEANQSKLTNKENSVEAYVSSQLADPNNKKSKNTLELEAWNKVIGGDSDKMINSYLFATLKAKDFLIDAAKDDIIKLKTKYGNKGLDTYNKRDKDKYEEAERILKENNAIASQVGLGKDYFFKFAEGGRVNFAEGTDNPNKTEIVGEEVIEENQTVPMKTVENLDYNTLRNRLPKEITDDIVQLLANSQQALADFAYIKTQLDVNDFNVKYGVNLVLPPETI